jgi:hypothetical protein
MSYSDVSSLKLKIISMYDPIFLDLIENIIYFNEAIFDM